MNRVVHAALAALVLTVAAFVLVRSESAPTTEVVWTEGFPDRVLYEMSPALFFPTGRTSARGNQLDVAFSDGASIKLELAADEAAARTLAYTWFEEGRATATQSSAVDDVYTLGSAAPTSMRAQITHIGRAAIKVMVPRDDDPAYLVTWIPGLKRVEVEHPFAAMRRERPAVFWGALVFAVATCVVSLIAAARKARAVSRSQ